MASSKGVRVEEQQASHGVVLLNMGGPATLDEVEPFLRELFGDPALIRLPLGRFWQPGFARLVAHRRAPRVRDLYRQIGGGSPIGRITEAQAEGLKRALGERALEGVVAVAMRYGRPTTADAVARLRLAGVDRLVVLSLYPQYSDATTGSSLTELRRVLEDEGLRWPLRVVSSYPTHPEYVRLLAETIHEALERIDTSQRGRAQILFSAHGLPEAYVRRGDPYAEQVRQAVSAVMDAGRFPNRWTLAFQSRVGPVKWLQPYTDQTIEQLGRAGVRALCVVPVSFVSDHVETLHEIDIEYRALAAANGIGTFVRAEVFNTRPGFVSFLADLVEHELKEASWIGS